MTWGKQSYWEIKVYCEMVSQVLKNEIVSIFCVCIDFSVVIFFCDGIIFFCFPHYFTIKKTLTTGWFIWVKLFFFLKNVVENCHNWLEKKCLTFFSQRIVKLIRLPFGIGSFVGYMGDIWCVGHWWFWWGKKAKL